MTGWFTAPIMAVLAALAAAALIWQTVRIEGLPIFGGGLKAQIVSITDDRDTLQTAIDDPDTGWRARLEQCQRNAAQLEGSVATQNAAVAAAEAEKLAADARAAEASRLAAIANARANRSAGEVLALRPVGEVCNAALELIREPSR